ncbi:hypothetical protein POM88_015622 [Heracleum sosnowskyi]|uniref:Uncharacterized protein n=1 Tax=Heracleum sosnowskyi TaxID=360622 RepID=A0AAD8IK85_9APIA|nr:hypothetical protein POM88_015622 [Heracleum sosnowskyi]
MVLHSSTLPSKMQQNDQEDFERYESTYISLSEDEISDYDVDYEDIDNCDSEEDLSNLDERHNLKFHTTESTSKNNDLPPCPEYKSLGFPTKKCKYCGSTMWNEERVSKNNLKEEPEFSICCAKGQIKLQKSKPTLPYLRHVYYDEEK